MSSAVITTENVAVLVQMYFESQHATYPLTDFKKFTNYWQTKGNVSLDNDLVATNLYDVFWAIRILADRADKYDFDDIEFHCKKNPVFAEDIGNQVGILNKAIEAYLRKAAQRAN